ncbi:hypothetical protein LAZ67_1005402 [Cordylochernes scorpioides]|uniref:Peptidase A2 domain-containing protein n=1 Tax=Cordylochernes scorpioides TaxID=51811 RepID=A0ABY6JYY5_9ARAC|nr:hypothetical protein LAZ67_1005402 [Cordylochernes scorpioides]
MSRDERILQRKLSCQIRRIDGFIESVDSIIEADETIRLEIMGEELKEIKEKIEKLYDELFSLDEVDIDKESEAYDGSMNKIGSLRANCNDSHVLLATARIKIKNGLGKLCTCRALLDSGSQVTMITKGCCERLGLVQRKSDRMIIGVGNTPVQHSSSTVSVTFCPLNNSEEFSVEAVVTGVLTSEIPNFRLKDPNWPTLKNLKLADPEFYIQAPIDMILGADIYTELMLNGSISLGEGLPMAINTRLGWVLLGKLMGTSESNTEVCNLSLQSEPELEFVMKRFWEIESVPSPDLCTQDEDCERQHRPLLGESREKALRKFLSLEGKLCKNVKLYDQYRGFMKEYEHLNHMERVPIAEVKRELCRCYYMSHHPVDADYQRILWRPSPEEPVVDYRLLTVTYGTTSAPFLAMRTLQQLAEDEGQNYPEASRVTLNDFYVDDLLTGAQTIAETKELIDQLKDLMKKGGFHLRKWNSNCHEIVSHVEEINEERKINLEKGAISKILGIVWDHVQDTFRVNITLPEEVVTKRDLLSNIARIFDPIGFLSPTTVAMANLQRQTAVKEVEDLEGLPVYHRAILKENGEWPEVTKAIQCSYPKVFVGDGTHLYLLIEDVESLDGPNVRSIPGGVIQLFRFLDWVRAVFVHAGKESKYLWKLNLKSKQWTELPTYVKYRDSQYTAVALDLVFILGPADKEHETAEKYLSFFKTRRFEAGRISIEDDPRQGRPKFQRTDENVKKFTDLIKENPRTTLLELEQDTGISKTTIGRIVTEDLRLKKTPAKFIPRFLTNEQNLCRLATCENMLEMTRTDPEWKDKIITGDETWVFGYDPETKRQSAEWRGQVIAPNDFFLFPKLEAVLKGRHFDTRDYIIEKSLLALKSIPKEAYKNCFDNWEKRWRCTCVRGVVMKSNREFENRAAIIVALRAGRSPKEIVDFLKLPKTTIYRVKKQFDEADSNKEGIATRKKHSRRSDRVRGEEFVKNVKEKIDGNPGKSMRAIAKEMDVGSMTIVRTIHEDLGLKSYALRKGSSLTVNPRNDRWICKDPSEIPVVMHTKFPASVMVLGVISSEGDVMPPHFFEKGLRMNADTYINVLETVVKPWMDMVAAGRNTRGTGHDNHDAQWRILHLSDYLQDEALIYHYEILSNIRNWPEAKEKLINRFQKIELTPLVEAIKVYQGEQETISDYYHRKIKMINLVDLPSKSIVELLNEGILKNYKPYLAIIDTDQPLNWLTMAIKVENSLTGSGTPVEKGRLQTLNPALHPSPRPAGYYGNSQVQRPPMPCRICERLGLELQWHYHSVCPYRSPTASRSPATPRVQRPTASRSFSSASPHSYQAAASSSFPPPTPHDYQPTVPSASSPDSPRYWPLKNTTPKPINPDSLDTQMELKENTKKEAEDLNSNFGEHSSSSGSSTTKNLKRKLESPDNTSPIKKQKVKKENTHMEIDNVESTKVSVNDKEEQMEVIVNSKHDSEIQNKNICEYSSELSSPDSQMEFEQNLKDDGENSNSNICENSDSLAQSTNQTLKRKLEFSENHSPIKKQKIENGDTYMVSKNKNVASTEISLNGKDEEQKMKVIENNIQDSEIKNSTLKPILNIHMKSIVKKKVHWKDDFVEKRYFEVIPGEREDVCKNIALDIKRKNIKRRALGYHKEKQENHIEASIPSRTPEPITISPPLERIVIKREPNEEIVESVDPVSIPLEWSSDQDILESNSEMKAVEDIANSPLQISLQIHQEPDSKQIDLLNDPIPIITNLENVNWEHLKNAINSVGITNSLPIIDNPTPPAMNHLSPVQSTNKALKIKMEFPENPSPIKKQKIENGDTSMVSINKNVASTEVSSNGKDVIPNLENINCEHLENAINSVGITNSLPIIDNPTPPAMNHLSPVQSTNKATKRKMEFPQNPSPIKKQIIENEDTSMESINKNVASTEVSSNGKDVIPNLENLNWEHLKNVINSVGMTNSLPIIDNPTPPAKNHLSPVQSTNQALKRKMEFPENPSPIKEQKIENGDTSMMYNSHKQDLNIHKNGLNCLKQDLNIPKQERLFQEFCADISPEDIVDWVMPVTSFILNRTTFTSYIYIYDMKLVNDPLKFSKYDDKDISTLAVDIVTKWKKVIYVDCVKRRKDKKSKSKSDLKDDNVEVSEHGAAKTLKRKMDFCENQSPNKRQKVDEATKECLNINVGTTSVSILDEILDQMSVLGGQRESPKIQKPTTDPTPDIPMDTSGKKRVHWKDDLVEKRYFEVIPGEREYVCKEVAIAIKKEVRERRRRRYCKDDGMKASIPWRTPETITISPPVEKVQIISDEKYIQIMYEERNPPEYYPYKCMIPFSPGEPDVEVVDPVEPVIIPLEKLTEPESETQEVGDVEMNSPSQDIDLQKNQEDKQIYLPNDPISIFGNLENVNWEQIKQAVQIVNTSPQLDIPNNYCDTVPIVSPPMAPEYNNSPVDTPYSVPYSTQPNYIYGDRSVGATFQHGFKNDKNLANLIKRNSKSFKNRLSYCQMLQVTDENVLEMLIENGLWETLKYWISNPPKRNVENYIVEILKVYKIIPINLELLKQSPIPKKVESYIKKDCKEIKDLAEDIVNKRTKVNKNTFSANKKRKISKPIQKKNKKILIEANSSEINSKEEILSDALDTQMELKEKTKKEAEDLNSNFGEHSSSSGSSTTKYLKRKLESPDNPSAIKKQKIEKENTHMEIKNIESTKVSVNDKEEEQMEVLVNSKHDSEIRNKNICEISAELSSPDSQMEFPKYKSSIKKKLEFSENPSPIKKQKIENVDTSMVSINKNVASTEVSSNDKDEEQKMKVLENNIQDSEIKNSTLKPILNIYTKSIVKKKVHWKDDLVEERYFEVIPGERDVCKNIALDIKKKNIKRRALGYYKEKQGKPYEDKFTIHKQGLNIHKNGLNCLKQDLNIPKQGLNNHNHWFQNPQSGFQQQQFGFQHSGFQQSGIQHQQNGFQQPQCGFQDQQSGFQHQQSGFQHQQIGNQHQQSVIQQLPNHFQNVPQNSSYIPQQINKYPQKSTNTFPAKRTDPNRKFIPRIPCRHFARGYCRLGDACNFLHPQ